MINNESTFIYNHKHAGRISRPLTLDQVENVHVFCHDSCSIEMSWLIIGILEGEREEVKKREE